MMQQLLERHARKRKRSPKRRRSKRRKGTDGRIDRTDKAAPDLLHSAPLPGSIEYSALAKRPHSDAHNRNSISRVRQTASRRRRRCSLATVVVWNATLRPYKNADASRRPGSPTVPRTARPEEMHRKCVATLLPKLQFRPKKHNQSCNCRSIIEYLRT